MAFKKISQQRAFDIIRSELIKEMPSFNFDKPVSKDLVKRRTCLLAGTRYGFYTVISRIIADNIMFKSYFANGVYVYNKSRVDLDVVFRKLGIDRRDFCKSYRGSPTYGLICRE